MQVCLERASVRSLKDQMLCVNYQAWGELGKQNGFLVEKEDARGFALS